MAFVATFKQDYHAEIKEGFSIPFKKGEFFKVADTTDIFHLIDLGLSTPIAIRKELLAISGTGVEWYADSFHQLYQDKTSWKKRFRMHIANESEQFTYEINMRLVNGKWEYTEVNQYTNGTDAKKIGIVEDKWVKELLYRLLEEDEKFERMMQETEKQMELIEKISSSDFEIKTMEQRDSPYRDEIRLKAELMEEPNYWFSMLYNPTKGTFEYLYLVSRSFSFNLKGIINQSVKEKILSFPGFDTIVLSKTS